MKLVPGDIIEKLEFDKIIQILQDNCYAEVSSEKIADIGFSADKAWILNALAEVEEYRKSMVRGNKMPIGQFDSVSEFLNVLLIEDYVLDIDDVLKIKQLLDLGSSMDTFMTEENRFAYPLISGRFHSLDPMKDPKAQFRAIFDNKGEIKENASDELRRITQQQKSMGIQIQRQFQQIVSKYKQSGKLASTEESVRNGRNVLAVPVELKRQIKGIIHDQSATGKTVYIEPEDIIDLNNALIDLEHQKRREIIRLLRELCNSLSVHSDDLKQYEDFFTQLDIIQSKASLAEKLDCKPVILEDSVELNVKKAYHPYLLYKNLNSEAVTVPFDLFLNEKNRILVLSGPNAGGKSVCMKAIGLIQLMLQAGIPVPVNEGSSFPVFEKLCADIGDQQSLDDDLSTYSSRLQNMQSFLEECNGSTLLLIDEFGSGTDPKAGGAIAESLLKEFNKRKCLGLITTHYSNLKMFAYKTKGLVNGSMIFDEEKMQPTYELKVGRPGSSYAFEIAQRTGLPKVILKYARFRTGKHDRAVDQLLVDLQREKKEAEEKLINLEEKQKQLDRLIKNYEGLFRDLEYKRKKIKLEQKERDLQAISDHNRALEKVVRDIRESQNLEKAKSQAKKAKEEKKELFETIGNINKELGQKVVAKSIKKPFEVGDFVKMVGTNSVGKIEKIKKNKAEVVAGLLRLSVPLSSLQHSNEPLDIRKGKSINTDSVNKVNNAETRLDIRGFRVEEAQKRVEEFIDMAMMTNTTFLKIIHGKGNGILRKVVRAKANEYGERISIKHPEEEQGGSGVSLIEIH